MKRLYQILLITVHKQKIKTMKILDLFRNKMSKNYSIQSLDLTIKLWSLADRNTHSITEIAILFNTTHFQKDSTLNSNRNATAQSSQYLD